MYEKFDIEGLTAESIPAFIDYYEWNNDMAQLFKDNYDLWKLVFSPNTPVPVGKGHLSIIDFPELNEANVEDIPELEVPVRGMMFHYTVGGKSRFLFKVYFGGDNASIVPAQKLVAKVLEYLNNQK